MTLPTTPDGGWVSPFGLYPIVIRESRYQGTYEDGAWFAIANCHEIPEEAISEDSECQEFWLSEKAQFIGRGATPNEAVIDLVSRNPNKND
jgi:hypothetical protein